MLLKFKLYIINFFLYYLAKLIPKKNEVWVFGSWFGNTYSDNSKYLFEYINHNHTDIKAIWISKNKGVVKQVRDYGYIAHQAYSVKAILYGLIAKNSIFVQTNHGDLMPFINNNRTNLIQLWHGIPLKKIGLDDSYASKATSFKHRIKKFFFRFSIESYNLIIACSKLDQEKFLSSFNCQKVSITGYPRNDFLNESIKTDQFVVSYLPTFRDNIGDEVDLFSNYKFSINSWSVVISEYDFIFKIKMHPVNKPKKDLLKKLNSIQGVRLLDNEDAVTILANTDILITDYSSSYFDFLLTDRPIIFAPFDFDKYITKDRELYYDYDEVTPGPKCKDWNEVLNWVVKFKEDPSLFQKEREIVRNKFHTYQDNKSCERVYKAIKKLN